MAINKKIKKVSAFPQPKEDYHLRLAYVFLGLFCFDWSILKVFPFFPY